MFSHRERAAIATGDAQACTLWALGTLPDSSAQRLEAWLDMLGELTLADWADIGRVCEDPGVLAAMTRGCKAVESVVADRELDVTAWLVRDHVETVTHAIRVAAARQPRRRRARLAVARMAAEWAALSMAMDAWLAPADRDALRAPFGLRTRRTVQVGRDTSPADSSPSGSGRANSSVAMPGTRRTKTLPPPSRS